MEMVRAAALPGGGSRGGVSGAIVAWPLADMPLSGMIDTLSLPCTHYRQHRDR